MYKNVYFQTLLDNFGGGDTMTSNDLAWMRS